MESFWGEEPSQKGGLTGLPGWAGLLLSGVQTLEQSNLDKLARAHTIDRYYKALGNAASLYNRQVPYLYDLARQSYGARQAIGKTATSNVRSMWEGGKHYDPFQGGNLSPYLVTMPPTPGPFQMGGGIPPSQLGQTPYEAEQSQTTGNDPETQEPSGQGYEPSILDIDWWFGPRSLVGQLGGGRKKEKK